MTIYEISLNPLNQVLVSYQNTTVETTFRVKNVS